MGHCHRVTLFTSWKKRKGSRQERLGFAPRLIVDIGAHVGNWSREARQARLRCSPKAREVFPFASFLMIEANPLHQNELETVGYTIFLQPLLFSTCFVKYFL